MAEITSYQPYDELLKVFRQKIDYLKRKVHLEQQMIARDIGEYPANLSRYLDIKNRAPVASESSYQYLPAPMTVMPENCENGRNPGGKFT